MSRMNVPFSRGLSDYIVLATPTGMANHSQLKGIHSMKIIPFSIALLFAASLSLQAGPAEEKSFAEKYKKAFEAKDTATLESFLYTKGSDPGIIEFYKMMMTSEAGGKISKINVVVVERAHDLKEEQRGQAGQKEGNQA